MIHLVVTNAHQTTTHVFDLQSVIIGKEGTQAQLPLSDESLLERHVQIIENENGYFVVNLANDPFVSLNGLPFGKQPLNDQDIIQLGNITIRFEGKSKSQPEPNTPTINEKEPVLSAEEVDALIRQVETLAENETKAVKPIAKIPVRQKPPRVPPQTQSLPKPKVSLKDSYLSEYDDQGDIPKNSKQGAQKIYQDEEISYSWGSLFKIAASVIGIITIICALLFLWISDQSGEEEIKASRSVADVAMALTYAQIKQIRPQNQNWSDPEFIRNTLNAVLASEFSSFADFDSHGQFASCSYMLRIYTSSDLSQFLVIAQPAPSLLQWLVPKATVIVDSKGMEMRKITDLKILNRLLVNTYSLDGIGSGEVSNLVHQGELIPLTHLVSKKENQGFSPPKALALIRPGAENFVYNAPRYHALGENLINRAIELTEKPSTQHETSLIQQETAAFSKLPSLVLYSSGGIQQAIQAQKALLAVVTKEKPLIAYLQVNNKGQISSSHLLMDESPSDIAVSEKNFEISSEQSNKDNPDSEIDKILSEEFDNVENVGGIDRRDPIYLQLISLRNSRQTTLKPISSEMILLLGRQTRAPQSEFLSRLEALQTKFLEINEEQRALMAHKVGVMARENPNLPAAQFVEYVKEAGLDSALEDYLNTLKQHSATSNPQLMDHHLEKISDAINWQELEVQVTEISTLLTFEQIPDEEQLINYQTSVKSHIIQKINQFLLSPERVLSPSAFVPENRQTLINILKAAWISDPDAYNFYLDEFEQHSSTSERL